MSDQDLSTTPETNHGVRVVCAALGINLALGILYTWSVIGGGAVKEWGWSASDKAWPYAVACLAFCLIMVPAGRMQDKMGPRIVASLGGVLVGVGMIVASFTTTPMGYIIGFGILAGSGIGFAYSSATPPSISLTRWPICPTSAASRKTALWTTRLTPCSAMGTAGSS